MDSPSTRTPAAGVGARLVADVLEGGLLPAYVPGDPGPLGATIAGHGAAPAFLARLGEAYGVSEWSPDELKRAFLDGAMREWHGRAKVRATTDELRVSSPVCPIAEDIERDARLCIMCQAFQIAVTREALGPRIGDVGFEAIIQRGAPECVEKIEVRAPK